MSRQSPGGQWSAEGCHHILGPLHSGDLSTGPGPNQEGWALPAVQAPSASTQPASDTYRASWAVTCPRKAVDLDLALLGKEDRIEKTQMQDGSSERDRDDQRHPASWNNYPYRIVGKALEKTAFYSFTCDTPEPLSSALSSPLSLNLLHMLQHLIPILHPSCFPGS